MSTLTLKRLVQEFKLQGYLIRADAARMALGYLSESENSEDTLELLLKTLRSNNCKTQTGRTLLCSLSLTDVSLLRGQGVVSFQQNS